jgi:hypothetical protein
MAGQKIKQGNIFGRIGSGLGQGLAEQLPKEVERYRLASGLEDISNQTDLTPFQKFARLASQPGSTPQIVDSGSRLLQQEARGKALSDFQGQGGQGQPSQQNKQPPPFPINIPDKNEQSNGKFYIFI